MSSFAAFNSSNIFIITLAEIFYRKNSINKLDRSSITVGRRSNFLKSSYNRTIFLNFWSDDI
jgi:hypothetical protein